jgi:fucose 4-O-acetylase-like acetyltransferase
MKENRRLLPIDALRGTAMFFVGISHISFYLLTSAPQLSALLRALGFFATPNFLLMSGMACGYQFARANSGAAALRIVDRGLFVLVVGHFLVAGSLVYIVRPGTTFEHIVITDIIGLILCTAPLLRNVKPGRLLETGGLLLVLSSAIGQLWHPTTPMGAAFAGGLLGINAEILPDNGWVSPTLPLAGLFLIGSGLGKLIHVFQHERRGAAAWRPLLIGGATAMVCAVALNVARHFLKDSLAGTGAGEDALLALLNVRQKLPPSLAYALFYGGIGIALLGLIGMMPRGSRVPATVGRASFISYVSLQWLVDFIPRFAGFDGLLKSPVAALAYLLLVTVVMFSIAYVWDRYSGNRLLTVGLKQVPTHGSWALYRR